MSSHSGRLVSLRKEVSISQDIEALARDLFERACGEDTFDHLKQRAAFNRQDAGRLKHWINVAQMTAAEKPSPPLTTRA